ncbi:efflux transporter outer membrane subunit [Mitsuaria sp. 7]|uniref:efflux transporter outer membrane subunit n=1 Tax=Mitsuaria sp. 7 TaxID=1658665 RepID=UPI00083453EC|nr:efflux transporter outer membrane subunit [Mitsuaria sp. 7]
MHRRSLPFTLLSLPLLGACGSLSSPASPDPAPGTVPVPAQWQAPQPHGGQTTDLRRWWSQFDDPLLATLVTDAQDASPTVATAAANIADARAARQAGEAALLPTVDLGASASRARPEPGAPLVKSASASLQLQWELDVFGANRAGAQAAQARFASSQAAWHGARVSVAAEVAGAYADLRACEAQAHQLDQDAASRLRLAQLTVQATQAGARSPAAAALAQASAAEGRVALMRQLTNCDLLVKSLVALTAREETALRAELATRATRFPQPREFSVTSLPAEVLAQRPDIQAAERDVAAAGADATQAAARRWPRITLAGNLGAARSSSAGLSTDGTVWSVGPVAITFPLFDGGTRRANAEAARERHGAAIRVYAARLRTAVQEVESALVTLQSTALRQEDAATAALGYERSYRATAASYEAGASSLFEVEDARRSLLSSQSTLNELRHERLLAWISLYRAVGGGWASPAPDDGAATPRRPAPETTASASPFPSDLLRP